SDEGNYKKAKHTAAADTIGISLIQLTHAYFTGKTWAQNNLIPTPTGETVSEGFGIRGNPLVSKEITGGMKSIDIGGKNLFTNFY
ncbi:hypothetical protein ISU90_17955, partial [Leptospira borgpetersenii serovar Balcanica]|nr:hypothetical protein [Leptospira borgpetersenii serovar Balcanica]